jgi:hypothetical protein
VNRRGIHISCPGHGERGKRRNEKGATYVDMIRRNISERFEISRLGLARNVYGAKKIAPF